MAGQIRPQGGRAGRRALPEPAPGAGADPRAEGERIITDLPRGLGELVVIEGAGHYLHAQTPEKVVALALPFLARTLAHA
jgi:pimeloyl-ACP methyl ester carboxylesterase